MVQFGVSAGVRRKDFLVYTGSSVIAEQPQTSGFALCGPHPEWILGYVYLSRERSRGLFFFFLRMYSANNFSVRLNYSGEVRSSMLLSKLDTLSHMSFSMDLPVKLLQGNSLDFAAVSISRHFILPATLQVLIRNGLFEAGISNQVGKSGSSDTKYRFFWT